jgi:hypothetical protein
VLSSSCADCITSVGFVHLVESPGLRVIAVLTILATLSALVGKQCRDVHPIPFVVLAENFDQLSLLEADYAMGEKEQYHPRQDEQEVRKPDDDQWRERDQERRVERVSHIGKRALCNQLVPSI